MSLSAVKTLAALGKLSFKGTVDRLQHADWQVRIAAVDELADLGEHAAPHIEAIIACLEDENDNVRFSAIVTVYGLR